MPSDSTGSPSSITDKTIDVQGHRGSRGLRPENTIQAFIHAMELGVSTLELDLAVSKDSVLVVSHEPYFSHVFSTDPDGQAITKDDELAHNIHQLNFEQIAKYDVGLRPNPKFPAQVFMAASKPSLDEVVQSVKDWCLANDQKIPYYNIEIKRHPKYDQIFHPRAQEFAQLVIDKLYEIGIAERSYIQSFDLESLQQVRRLAPDLPTVLLIENERSIASNIDSLGYTPDVYSPYYKLVNDTLSAFCAKQKIKLIPWTVNDTNDMKDMLKAGVDGIITDYPDRLISLCRDEQIAILK